MADEKGELDLNPKLQQQLMDLLDYCKEQKLHVLFVRAPHYVTEDTYDRVKRSNKMASIVREYGYSYYACENEAVKIGIDDKRDFYNVDHMNVYGALKFTDYLAEKIIKEEELKIDPLRAGLYADWDEVVTSTNQLYRYCDDLMTKGDVKGAQEDVLTLVSLGNYSGDTIQR